MYVVYVYVQNKLKFTRGMHDLQELSNYIYHCMNVTSVITESNLKMPCEQALQSRIRRRKSQEKAVRK